MKWPIAAPTRTEATIDVVLLGENSLDFVGVGPRPAGREDKISLSAFETFTGGQTATAAVGCARQEIRTRYVGAFGKDDAARTIRSALGREGIDVVAVEPAGAKTRTAFVFVDARSGDRTVFEFRHPALAIAPADLPVAQLLGGRILMLDATDLPASIAAARLARAAGVPTVVDVDRPLPEVADLLSEIGVIVVPESFAIAWTGKSSPGNALTALADRFRPAIAIATLGSEGSLALVHGQEVRTRGFQVDVVDSTGAGDAFRAGLVSAWLRMGDSPELEQILSHANATAALNCLAVGAQVGLPRFEEASALVTRTRRGQSN